MPFLNPKDGVQKVRDIVQAPTYAIIDLMRDGKPRRAMEIYSSVKGFSLATVVNAFKRLKKARMVKPSYVGTDVGWVLRKDVVRIVESLEGHHKELDDLSGSEKTIVRE